MKNTLIKFSVFLTFFFLSTTFISAKSDVTVTELDRMDGDTLIIPFGTDWNPGGGHNGGHPTPIYRPTFAQTCDKIIVLSSYQMTIPYIIYKEGETTPTAQGNISVIPPCSDVISISQWEEGNYTIYITLAGRVFYGTFSIE